MDRPILPDGDQANPGSNIYDIVRKTLRRRCVNVSRKSEAGPEASPSAPIWELAGMSQMEYRSLDWERKKALIFLHRHIKPKSFWKWWWEMFKSLEERPKGGYLYQAWLKENYQRQASDTDFNLE